MTLQILPQLLEHSDIVPASAKCPVYSQQYQLKTPSKPRYLTVFLTFFLQYINKTVVALEVQRGGTRKGQREYRGVNQDSSEKPQLLQTLGSTGPL